jgi:hypothetical protein
MAKAQWELNSAESVAAALEWIRKRTDGQARVLLAVGARDMAFVKDPNMSPREAMDLLEASLPFVRAGFEKQERKMKP